MSTDAYLVSSPGDVQWVHREARSPSRLIAHDIVTAMQFSLPYFFPPSTESSGSARDIEYLVKNWYRGAADGVCPSVGWVSAGQAISGSLWIAIASLHREWFALARLLDDGDRVLVSKRETERFCAVARSFGDRVAWYEPGHPQRSLIETVNERRLALDGYPLQSPVKARIARLLASPWRWARGRRDTLYVNDWTLGNLVAADESGFTLFGRTLAKAAFPRLRLERVAAAESNLATTVPQSITAELLAECLLKAGTIWPATLLQLVAAEIRSRVSSLLPYLARCHVLFEDLFDEYQPRRIVCGGEMLEPHTLLMQMARARGLDVWFVNDGYLPSTPIGSAPALRGGDGNDWLISNVLVYGQAAKEQVEVSGFPAERVFLLRPTFIAEPVESDDRERFWEATIATWFPFHLNPESREEWTCRMTCEVADLLISMGYSRIAIKVKHASERETYIELQRRGVLTASAIVVWEPFQQHLGRTAMVIGGLGTGVLEAFRARVPYFIYEPCENGYSEACLASRVIDRQAVARTIVQLQSNIATGRRAVTRAAEDLYSSNRQLPWNASTRSVHGG